MGNRKKNLYRLLDSLYAEMPTVECAGHCGRSNDPACGAIGISELERQRIAERAGEDRLKPRADHPTLCPLFDVEHGRCTVYDIRPGICRLWGTSNDVPQLHCRYGCKVRPAPIDRYRAFAFMRATFKIGGKLRVLGRLLPEVWEAWATHEDRKAASSVKDLPSLGGSMNKALRRIEEGK